MYRKILHQSEGFTLIEIVLVLGIAALIIGIVFLGLSGANKARRDTQRKSDIGRLRAALEQYASNTNGSYPPIGPAGAFITNYLPNWNDPAAAGTGAYNLTFVTQPGTVPATGTITVSLGGVCNATHTADKGGGTAGNYAILTTFEQGGVHCDDNQ